MGKGTQIDHRRERCPQRSEKNGPSGTTVPTESLPCVNKAKLPTVGNRSAKQPIYCRAGACSRRNQEPVGQPSQRGRWIFRRRRKRRMRDKQVTRRATSLQARNPSCPPQGTVLTVPFSLPLKGKYILVTQGRPYNLSVKHTGNLQNNFPVFFRQGAKFSHYFIKIRLL